MRKLEGGRGIQGCAGSRCGGENRSGGGWTGTVAGKFAYTPNRMEFGNPRERNLQTSAEEWERRGGRGGRGGDC